MYGGSHKYGRGGGGGGGRGGATNKRNSFPPPPPPQRPSSANRLSLSSRKPASTTTTTTTTTSATAAATAANQSEESFSLIGGNTPSFAAIIRLAPDLVDEIKRVESLGDSAKIKFDSNPNNNSANVIDVGGKEFRFTWSHDMGDLCDIYEERQNGEDGKGLLVESGCSWRKLNVQRVLDESTKKHVKKRSEECEQKHKSRKAIVLDQCNPSMKSQMQALAAAEASPWKFKPKNKRYLEPSQVGGPSKPVKLTTGLSSTSSGKGRHSTSPLPSPQNQAALASAFVRGNATESQSIAENPTTFHVRAKDNAFRSENEASAQVSGQILEASVHRENQGAGLSDLQNMLVTSLKENPKGMSLKQLEKAVGGTASNSASKIEPILKKIAIYEHPGRYILKSGVQLESSKRMYSDGGSSPDDNNQKHFAPEDSHFELPTSDLGFGGKSPAGELEEHHVQNFDEESNMVEKFDATQHFSDLFGDDDPPEPSEGQTAKANDNESGSDSDSGSSDSGSDSASRSRSRTPAGSRSASSSDSEGDDSSSNSKEESDVEVDIMSDDDEEHKKLQGSEHGLSTWNMPEPMPLQDGGIGDQDGSASEDVDIENDFLDDNEVQLAKPPHNPGLTTGKSIAISPYHDQYQICDRTDVVNEQEDIEDEVQRKHHSSVKSGSKSKRGSNVIQFEHSADDAKRFKGNAAQSSMARHFGSRTLESPSKFSASVANEDNHDNHNMQIAKELNRDDGTNSHFGGHVGYHYNVSGRSALESLQLGQRPVSHSHITGTADRAVRNPSNLGVESKFQETNAYAQEITMRHEENDYQETQDEEDSSIGNANGKFKENYFGQKHSLRPEPYQKKHGERSRKSNSLGTSSRLQTGSSLRDGVKADFDKSPADRRKLQREPSELELGELREPLPEEPKSTKRKFGRGASFKHSEMKVGSSGSRGADLKSRTVSKPILDTVNTSPIARGAPNNSDNMSRRRSPEPNAEDLFRPPGAPQSQLQQSRNGHAEVGLLSNKAVDRSKLGHNEAVSNQGSDVEGYGETQKKSHINSQREDSRKETSSRKGPKGKGSKSKKSNTIRDTSDRSKNPSNNQGCNDKRKRSEYSSNENDSYLKYEKEEPELKGPIKKFSQYKEYVQEYREKYESYCSLNKILESYRNEFQKLGMDLDGAKGRDTERYLGILAQLKESYRQCGMRHKRLKKIFLVLHEELKQLKQMIKDFAVDYMKE